MKKMMVALLAVVMLFGLSGSLAALEGMDADDTVSMVYPRSTYAGLFEEAGIDVADNAVFSYVDIQSSDGETIRSLRMTTYDDGLISELVYLAFEVDQGGNQMAVPINDYIASRSGVDTQTTSTQASFTFGGTYFTYSNNHYYYYVPKTCTLQYVGSSNRGPMGIATYDIGGCVYNSQYTEITNDSNEFYTFNVTKAAPIKGTTYSSSSGTQNRYRIKGPLATHKVTLTTGGKEYRCTLATADTY